MAEWVLGDTISESFPVPGGAGQTFTRDNSQINNANTTWNPTFTDLGNGFYSYTYTPTVTGYHEWSGFASAGEPLSINFNVGSALTVSTVTGRSRRRLRRDISDLLGNMVLATATANGTTTTFIDDLTLWVPNNAYANREAYFAEGTADNLGISRGITTNTQSTKSLTFAALPAATATGDVCEIHNVRGAGWTTAEIHRAINRALTDTTAAFWSRDREDIAAAFDQDTPIITIPTAFYGVFGVSYQDDDGYWWEIPAAENSNASGWWVHRGEREIVVNGENRYRADAKTVRIYGYKQFAELTTDTDTTLANTEWVVQQACAYLSMQGRERVGDGSRERGYLQFQTRADRIRDLVAEVPAPDTVLVA